MTPRGRALLRVLYCLYVVGLIVTTGLGSLLAAGVITLVSYTATTIAVYWDRP